MQNKRQTFIATLLGLLLASCAVQPTSQPLDSGGITAKLMAKDPTSAVFENYLIEQGYAKENLPLTTWDTHNLTLSALFHHTKLDVAKKKLALSHLAIKTAGVKNTPTINGSIAHSNQKNDDIKPWAYGLSIDIPIETNNKRDIRVEKAESNAEAARMDVAETAWQLRHQITTDIIAHDQHLAEIQLLQQKLSAQASIAAMLEKRLSAGIASRTELSNATLSTLQTKHHLNNKRGQLNLIKAKLAADVGLTPEKFSLINIKPLSIENTLAQQAKVLDGTLESKTLQAQALLNRIDIRRSLAKYAAAEAEIKLQAARQIPDITLSPGILFEFGDSIWSLGFSSLFNLLHKNTTLIEEAKQLREIEGAQFEDLQANTIAQINQAQVRYLAAKQTMHQANSALNKQLEQKGKIKKQFKAGLIGKVAMKKQSLIVLVAKQQVQSAQFKLLQIANHIEDIMQKPLYSAFRMPISIDNKAI